LGLDPPVRRVEVDPVAHVPEADDVGGRRRGELEPRMLLDDPRQLRGEIAAARDEVLDAAAAERLQGGPDTGAAPAARGFEPELVQVRAGAGSEVAGRGAEGLVMQLGVADEREADSVWDVEPLVAVHAQGVRALHSPHERSRPLTQPEEGAERA